MSVSHSTFEIEAPPSRQSPREPLPAAGNRSLYCCAGKRALDILIAALGLIVLSPLLLLITVLVKVASHGPVLHRENRVGRDASIFEIINFRTTEVDTAQDAWVITIDNDEQVTPLGQFLRALSLDELPQLWNVLRGDMSIVGPRPEIPSYVAMYTRQQLRVLTVRPGIADMASVRCRHESLVLAQAMDRDDLYRREILPEKLLLDLEYIDRASLRLDLKVMVQTVCAILSGNRARQRSF